MEHQFFEERIQHQFDSYCKKTLRLTARDCWRRIRRRREREIVLSELSEQDLAKLAVTDEYFKDAYSFSVLGYEIAVSDIELAEALTALPADRRDIILLAYFLDMNDREIAERLNLVQRTVNYRRTSTLQEIKKSWREM